MFERVPCIGLLPLRPSGRGPARTTLWTVLLVTLLTPLLASAGEGGRFAAVEERVQGLIDDVQRLRAASPEAQTTRVASLIDAHVDIDAWLGDAVPDADRLIPADRDLLRERARALLVSRASRHLRAEGAARITIEKTRRVRRQVAVDCLIHTDEAVYEITLRWATGPRPRLRDVQVEGVSVGASDRRRVRRAWERGGLPATLAALDRATGRPSAPTFNGPPAVATRTTSGDPVPAVGAPPPAGRPPGL